MNGRRALGCSGILGLVLVIGSLAGCEYSPVTEGILASEYARLASTDLQAIVYPVVDEMLNQDPTLVPTGGPIVVGSIADLHGTSTEQPRLGTLLQSWFGADWSRDILISPICGFAPRCCSIHRRAS